MYPFVFYLFFFNAHDSQVWSFDGVAEFLHIPFTSRVILLRFLLFFFFNFFFIFEQRFCLPPVLVCWSGLPLCFLYDDREFLFLGFLFDSSEVFQIFVHFFYNFCCPLQFMYLSFYSVLCFTLVFVEVLSEFLYLFLCHLMFFVFGVLKFLECILYILVDHD
jgi:hypothetical protein